MAIIPRALSVMDNLNVYLTSNGLKPASRVSFRFKSKSGTIYCQLGMLSEWGFIRGEEQKTRTKYARRGATAYEMTEKGMKAFEEFKQKWKKPIEYAYKNLNT